MRAKYFFLVCVLFIIAAPSFTNSTLFAQQETVITFAAPNWLVASLTPAMFDEFEANHVGVDVRLVNSEAFYGTGAEIDINAHLDSTAEYASAADVLLITNYNLTPAATVGGNFLNLSPLVAVDATLNESDFFPVMWQSFQWDQGIWALPVSTSFNFFVYRTAEFDAAGLPYPNENWTFADFADAVRTLTQRDADGNVTLPGYVSFGTNYLLRSWLTQGYYDANAFPQSPFFTDPQLAELLNQWRALEEEGAIGIFDGQQSWQPLDVPLVVQPFSMVLGALGTEFDEAMLPGGVAGMDIYGVAVSAGTEQPELAYELAAYLTSSVELVVATVPMTAARQSIGGVRRTGSTTLPSIDAELAALIEQAVISALPASEMRFSNYVDQALINMSTNNLDAAAALQAMQQQATLDLQTAAERRGTDVVYVATPVPTPVVEGNEIVLRFDANLYVSPLPNQAGWDQFIADFAAQDPAVGVVQLSNGAGDTFAAIAQAQDCFYLPFNAVSSRNIPELLSLDPLFSADVNFNANDIAPGVLPQLQRNGLTYALPMTLQPQVLWYDNSQFTNAGVFPPENGWTVTEFEDALRLLQANDEANSPFSPGSNGAGYIWLLIAAYGGLPLDALANPPTMNFNDPANVAAIRQVLDLARNGYISYDPLADINTGGMFHQFAIYDDYIAAFNFETQLSQNIYSLTTYPRGTQYTPVSYAIGSGYISAGSQNPDACYRFLSALAQRPDLLGGMPVSQSVLNDSSFAASVSPAVLNFYHSYFETLLDPNLVVLPGNFSSSDQFAGIYFVQWWLYKAFDAYVLEGADLEAGLQQAQLYAESLVQCAVDTSVNECALLVDPTTSELLGGG